VQSPGQAHRAGAVTQVALHLTGHRGNGECREFAAARRVVALDRVQEADRAGLHEVVMLGAAALVAVREGIDEWEIELNEAVTRAFVPIGLVGRKQTRRRRFAVGPCRRAPTPYSCA
jgi:hypothetical protein